MWSGWGSNQFQTTAKKRGLLSGGGGGDETSSKRQQKGGLLYGGGGGDGTSSKRQQKAWPSLRWWGWGWNQFQTTAKSVAVFTVEGVEMEPVPNNSKLSLHFYGHWSYDFPLVRNFFLSR
jgi:hypothetical protein